MTTLNEQGFKPVRIADWHPEHTLRVLIGRDDTGAERAFFFVKRRFVGNDDATASASVRVSAARENGVTLTYRLFGADRPGLLPEGRARQGHVPLAGRHARAGGRGPARLRAGALIS